MNRLLRGHRVSMAVGWRLAAGLLPTLVAIALAIGLFYYGKLGREAPRSALFFAYALTIVSLIVTWANARYFAQRIGRLARVTRNAGGAEEQSDEFDQIEQVVDTLGTALSAAETDRARTDVLMASRRRDEATMLAGVIADALSRLDQVRLPLQILLEAPFGDLNENQEELLRDARSASDAIDSALRRLGQIADADRGAFAVQRELVQINDVVRSVLPLARSAAERRGARVDIALEPGLPRAMADRARLAEALALFVTAAAEATNQRTPLSVTTAREAGLAVIRITPRATDDDAAASTSMLASRLISVQGGELSMKDGALELRIGRVSS